ncbi:MAG: hypothetical protein R2749_06790 [Acidimicrobiales bacterium]
MIETDVGAELIDKLALSPQELGFDPAELKARYLAERDKRLREDGNDQYVEVTAEFSRYVDDPYVEPGFTASPSATRSSSPSSAAASAAC